MLQTITLCPGVTLRCVQSSRFKQGRISLQFVRPMTLQEAAMNALLPVVLLRGTENYPDLRQITMRLDDLYGASVGDLVRRIGDHQTTGLYASFTEDRFALPGDEILRPVAAFLQEALYRPKLEKGVFCEDIVESEKKNLLADLQAQKNDKQTYAANQLLKHMCREDSFGIPRLGTKKTIEAITPESLYRHYEKVIKESPVELFYVGSQSPEEVGNCLAPLFSGRNGVLPPQTAFCGGEESHIREKMDISQSRLHLGFVTEITNRDPRFCAMQILNHIYGSGMTSKLFMTVREQLSLCYSISSGYYGSKGIMVVAAGIDSKQEQTTRQEILKQLQLCKDGQITPAELESARESLVSGLKAVPDSPGALESYYATAALSGLNMDPETYRRRLEQVTLADVVAAANTVTLRASYFLEGL